MKRYTLMLAVCLVVSGCQPTPPPEPAVAPPPEDLSQWTVPTLVQPPPRKPPVPVVAARASTPAETVYTYAPGQVYKVTVALDAPLDVILEAGEHVQTVLDSDPKPIVQGQLPPEQGQAPPKPDVKARWEYREAVDGLGPTARPHLLIRAVEADATAGVTITTTKRVYYLTCKSVKTSLIRAVRWTYLDEPPPVVDGPPPSLLPSQDGPHVFHVGYIVSSQGRSPDWFPRYVVDDGKKLYIIYPEVTLFGTVPLVRAIGVNGPAVLNTWQHLNVVGVDSLPPRLELRVGVAHKDQQAEVVTITRGALRTIACPGDDACPVWPVAARQLAERSQP